MTNNEINPDKFSEVKFISYLQRELAPLSKASVGIGDDCAVFAPTHQPLLMTTDMLMDGTHFDTRTTSLSLIGRKALAVSLSDIAAMGGTPESASVALAIPRSLRPGDTETLMRGIRDIAKEFACGVDGGDTNVWNGPLVISITLHGTPHWRGPVLRSTANPGDVVVVTGPLGGSLHEGRHLSFIPRINEARWILDQEALSAMMDISDVLATDLRRLAAASSACITIHAQDIPRHPSIRAHSTQESIRAALCDGEDFELVFTAPIDTVRRLQKSWPFPNDLTIVGEVSRGSGLNWTTSEFSVAQPCPYRGFEHR